MAETDFCSNCAQGHDCKKAYRQLGGFKGPSIAGKAFLVFLLPIIVFIVVVFIISTLLSAK